MIPADDKPFFAQLADAIEQASETRDPSVLLRFRVTSFGASGIFLHRCGALVMFDEVGPLHLFAPSLTAIRQPVADIGAHAVALLMVHIAGTTPPDPQPACLTVELVARGSTTCRELGASCNSEKGALA